jgi:ubiquinone/menaquinone biosynthesis C-methylase UbiE
MNRSNQSRTSFDGESATEMARLILQDRLLNRIMPELVPNNRTKFRHVLDIGCGAGGWAIDVAHHFPKSRIIGIDISPAMITYASDLAVLHSFKNCQFKLMDALNPLAFSDRFFDLVQIRMMRTTIPKDIWPTLLKECFRITRKGGILQRMECEQLITNSPALADYNRFFTRLLHQRGCGLSSDSFVTREQLSEQLENAGYRTLNTQSFSVDFSAGTPWHNPQSQCIESFCSTLLPVLVQEHIATRQEVENRFMALIEELGQSSFQGILLYHAISGEKR